MAGEREKWWWGREEMRESKEEATARFYTGNMAVAGPSAFVSCHCQSKCRI